MGEFFCIGLDPDNVLLDPDAGTMSLYDLICSPRWLLGLRMVGLALGFSFGAQK